MAFTISYQFLAIDKFSRVGNKIADSFHKVERRVNSAHKATDKLANSMKKVSSAAQGAFVGFTLPLTGFLAVAFKAQSQLEDLQITFESSLQSTTKAKAMVEDLVNFAKTTPFRMQGVVETGRMLLGFGVKQEELMDRMTKLGDVAAGTGRPVGDLAMVFGQVKAKGRLLGEEINQFAERGLPLLEILAKGTGRTKKEILDFASKGAISFEMFQKAFDQMHELRYKDNMVKLSNSLGGLWSTLLDTFQLAAASFFKRLDKLFDIKGKMKSMIRVLNKASEGFNAFVDNNPKLAKMIFLIAGTIAVVAALGVAILPVVIGIASFSIALKALGAAFAAVGAAAAFLVSPIGLIIGTIAALVTALYVYRDEVAEWLSSLVEVFKIYLGKVKDWFKSLVAAMSDEYDAIVYAITHPFEAAFVTVMAIFDKIKSVYDSITGFLSDAKTIDVKQSMVHGFQTPTTVPTTASPYGSLSGVQLGANTRTDVNVNLNAPRGTVGEVTAKTHGFSAANVGTNLEEY